MTLSPAAQRGRLVRRRLLHAAAELIAERGWTAVSTRILAERAEVAPGLVHYHFASLQALLTEAALGVLRDLVDGLARHIAAARTVDDLVDLLLGALGDYSGRDPGSLLISETYLAATRDDELRAGVSAMVADFRRQLGGRLAEHTVASPEATAATLTAAIDGIMLHRALSPDLTADDLAPILRRILTPSPAECRDNRKDGEARSR